jgi:hypothetical protein
MLPLIRSTDLLAPCADPHLTADIRAAPSNMSNNSLSRRVVQTVIRITSSSITATTTRQSKYSTSAATKRAVA